MRWVQSYDSTRLVDTDSGGPANDLHVRDVDDMHVGGPSPKNPHTLPEEALYIVRFHSLYAYHRDGAYRELMDDKDRRLLPVLQQFNQYDLYSKSDTLLDIEALRPYYTGLMETYLGRGWWWV